MKTMIKAASAVLIGLVALGFTAASADDDRRDRERDRDRYERRGDDDRYDRRGTRSVIQIVVLIVASLTTIIATIIATITAITRRIAIIATIRNSPFR